MTMSSHVAPSVAEVLRTLLGERSESSGVFAVDFTEKPVAALVEVLADLDDPPSVRVLATESVLKWLRRDFHLASTAADLVAAETLSLQVPGEETFEPALAVDEESVISVVTAGSRAVGLGTDDMSSSQICVNAALRDGRPARRSICGHHPVRASTRHSPPRSGPTSLKIST